MKGGIIERGRALQAFSVTGGNGQALKHTDPDREREGERGREGGEEVEMERGKERRPSY